MKISFLLCVLSMLSMPVFQHLQELTVMLGEYVETHGGIAACILVSATTLAQPRSGSATASARSAATGHAGGRGLDAGATERGAPAEGGAADAAGTGDAVGGNGGHWAAGEADAADGGPRAASSRVGAPVLALLSPHLPVGGWVVFRSCAATTTCTLFSLFSRLLLLRLIRLLLLLIICFAFLVIYFSFNSSLLAFCSIICRFAFCFALIYFTHTHAHIFLSLSAFLE